MENTYRYFIEIALDHFQRLKDSDFDYCYTFYECLKKHYKEINRDNQHFDMLFKYLFHQNSTFMQPVGKETFTEKIIGDKYIGLSQNDNLLYLKGTDEVDDNSEEKVHYLKLDSGTLWFNTCAYNFIHDKSENYKADTAKTTEENEKVELSSWNTGSKNIVTKILRFARAEVYKETYDKLFCTISMNLARSITLGEFFILDNYSDDYLDKMYSWDKSLDGEEEINTQGFYGQMLNNIGEAASKIRSMCRTMGQILKNQSGEVTPHPIRVVGFNNTIPFPHGGLSNLPIDRLWVLAVESVALIAYMDFAYFTTFQNIETLIVAREYLKELNNRYDVSTSESGFVINGIIIPNLVKAGKLLHAFVTFHNENEAIDKDLERTIMLQDHKTDDAIRKEGIFKKNFPEALTPEDFKKTSKELKSSTTIGHDDLNRYTVIGCKYLNKKIAGNSLFTISRQEKLNEKDFIRINEESNDDKVWTTSLLLKIIQRVTLYAQNLKEVDKALAACNVASRLLDRLKLLSIEYEEGNLVPGKIERPFQNSFHKVSCNLKYSDDYEQYKYIRPVSLSKLTDTLQFGEDSIMFMQSISTQPVALNFIKRFIQKYTLELSEMKLNFTNIIQEKAAGQLKQTEKLADANKDFQAHSLQLLGILGSFIALVSVGANAISDVPTQHFFEFLIVITGCVVALLVCITAVTSKKIWQKIVILLLLLIVTIGTWHWFIHQQSNSLSDMADKSSITGNVPTVKPDNPHDSLMMTGQISVRLERSAPAASVRDRQTPSKSQPSTGR